MKTSGDLRDPTCTVWTMRATTSHAACSPPALGRHTQFGVLDNGYKFDMDDQEALELAHKAIHHAIFRDLASGGIVRGGNSLGEWQSSLKCQQGFDIDGPFRK